MPDNPDISVIIPVYDEDESIVELSQWIEKVLLGNRLTFEVIFIDDGSKDESWTIIENLSNEKKNIKGIRFSRNYGKSAALNTGFRAATGKVVVTLDADLQDSPDEIPALYKMVREEGYDLVSGWKKQRRDSFIKRTTSKFFNFVTRKISRIKLHDFNCGLKAYSSKVIRNLSIYGEMHRYIPVIVKWNGYDKIGEKVVTHYPRKYGRTKFGMERFINGFLDLISITFVMRFVKKPMHFFGTLGTLSFLLGLVITFWIIGIKIYQIQHHLPVREITSQPLFFLALVALIIGAQMFMTGFLAEILTLNSDKTSQYLIIDKKGFE